MRKIALTLSLLLTACSTTTTIMAKKKAYVGNSIDQTVERKQDGEVIHTNDPQFNSMICMFDNDFEDVLKKIDAKKKETPCKP